jgi:D-3-phosphoglycerate dehydrogenase
MNKKRLLLPHNLGRGGWEAAAGRDDIEAIAFDDETTSRDLHPALREADGIALNYTRFGEAEICAAPRLRAVGRIGVGYDTVDVAALTRHRVPLMLTGRANSASVAEQTIAFLMALAKKTLLMDRMVRDGEWHDRLAVEPVELLGKAMLIVGFGRIGRQVGRCCLALEMKVLAYDPYVSADTVLAAGCEPVPELDAGIERADFVAILCPKTQETTNFFDAARLARLKPSAFLINAARGGMVDEDALHAALGAGAIAGAALDVFAQEPPRPDHPLFRLPNVVFAPHLAGVTREALDRMARVTVENLLSVLDGRPNLENVLNREVLA